jgi:AraC-like DNA-binding protein
MLTSLPADEAVAPAGAVHRLPLRRPGLPEIVSSVWLTTVPASAAVLRVLPDAAVDVVFAGGRLVVAGPDTGPVRERLPPGPVLGLQLRPRAVQAVLNAPASAALDGRIEAADLWGPAGRDLLEQLNEAPSLAHAQELIEDALLVKVRGAAVDPMVGQLRQLFRRGHPSLPSDVGLSERQLRRRCVAAFGYPPRTLRRVVRFQGALERIRAAPATPLAELAALSGYVDQAHLARDVGTFSGLTPSGLRSALAPPVSSRT